MWKRSVGIALIVFGLFASITPVLNLWNIWHVWYASGIAGIEFVGDPSIAETFHNLWIENLVTLIGLLTVVVSGILILFGPRLPFISGK